MKNTKILSLLLILTIFFSSISISNAANAYSFKANMETPTGFDKEKIVTVLKDKDGKEIKGFKLGQEIQLNSGENYSLKISGLNGYILTGKNNNGKEISIANNTVDINIKSNTIFNLTAKKDNIIRIAGEDRFTTSLNIAKNSYENPKAIILANGIDRFSVDALAVGPLANELQAPILLVEKEAIDIDILRYVKNLDKNIKIYIVGGQNSISQNLINTIITETEINKNNFTRISGANRYLTSLEIAKILWNSHGYNKTIVLAHGTITADALAASTYATQEKYPIILTDTKGMETNTKNYLKDSNISKVVIIGGEKLISQKIITNEGFEIKERIAGLDREETSIEIAKKLNSKNSVIIANGYKGSVDALAASSLANTKNAPILLIGGKLTNGHKDIILNANNKKRYIGYITGGTKHIPMEIQSELSNLIGKLPE